jgi:hypothetical protein
MRSEPSWARDCHLWKLSYHLVEHGALSKVSPD